MGDQVKEISGQFTDIVAITELRGSYPNVPIASDVDYAALIAGDSDPTFITIPVGKANVISGNQRFYDEAWLQELERQTLARKPIGLMGHLSEAQRATAMPDEAVLWVGAIRVDDTLWAKGYLPVGPARDRIKRYKAQGKSLATSIDAFAEGVWSQELNAYHMKASTMKLGQIDFAPSDRAGIPQLAAVPLLTKEMSTHQALDAAGEPAIVEQEITVDKTQIIREMTVEDAVLLPKPVRDSILATVQPPPEVATVATIRETLGLDAKTDVAAHIAEMKRTQAEQAKAAVTNRIKELVEAGVKLEEVRGDVTELVTARNPQTVAEAETITAAVLEMPIVKKLLSAHVTETMGPPQRTPVAGKQGNRYFVIPAAE